MTLRELIDELNELKDRWGGDALVEVYNGRWECWDDMTDAYYSKVSGTVQIS